MAKQYEYYELTNPQKNIYLREEYYKNTAINLIGGYIVIKEKIDPEIARKMLNLYIKENDSIRTRIIHDKKSGKVLQYIKEYKDEKFKVIDGQNKKEKEINKMIEEDLKKPLNFFNSKLYEFKIYILKNKTILTCKSHHIISDAWSYQLLMNRVVENYTRVTKKEISEEKYSYVDYIKAEQEYFSSDSFKKDEEYWQEYLNEVYEPAILKDINLSRKIDSERKTKVLPKKTYLNLMKYCKSKNITPYVFFLSVLSTYIYKTTGKSQFILGTPLLNRKNSKEKNIHRNVCFNNTFESRNR